MNALYFKGYWLYKFDKNATKNMPFYVNKENSVDVPTMNIKSELLFGSLREINAKFVILPYSV